MKSTVKISVGMKLYVFIVVTVLGVAAGTAVLAHQISANQIDNYYKQVTHDTAVNFASFVDGDYLGRLRKAAETEEYQALREVAVENDDESLVQDFLEEKGLWEEYAKTREDLNEYLNNMDAIRYLYIMAIGDEDAPDDMYLMDDYDNPLYVLGYYEKREPAYIGLDFARLSEPQISNGEWGWLCSVYAPVYDSQGNAVCYIGCDFGMDDIMAERNQSLRNVLLAAAALTTLVLIIAVILVSRIVVRPLVALTSEMKKFEPSKSASYDEAGVINLDIKSHDEIRELHDGIRAMQINIIDYLNDLFALRKDKERAEMDIKTRDEQIGQISKEAYHDVLTGVGSKAAYAKKVKALEGTLAKGDAEIALVMVDMNNLKTINDTYGHKSGDRYIQGCCRLITDIFQTSSVFRIGGDEFLVVVEGPDYARRHELVATLKRAYETSSENKEADPWFRYSAAVGMSELAADDNTLDLAFKRADRAMYEDKRRFKQEHHLL